MIYSPKPKTYWTCIPKARKEGEKGSSTWKKEKKTNCYTAIKINSTGATEEYQPDILGSYVEDGMSNGKISYINKNNTKEKLYLYFSPGDKDTDDEWFVSDVRGEEVGWLHSKCKKDCPQACLLWAVWDGQNKPKWINDTTLSL